MAVRPKAQVYVCSPAGIVGSNSSGGMDGFLLRVLCDVRCDELITRPKELYRLCRVAVCDLETS